MALSRKDLLVSETKAPPSITDREDTILEEGMAFAQMRGTYGWKLLVERYIAPKVAKNRFFTAKTEELAEIRSAMKELQDLVDLIDRRVEEATKIAERRKNQ